MYGGPLRSGSSLTIGGPLRSLSLLNVWGPPQIRFFAYYMGAPSSQFLRFLYGGPLRSISSLTMWGPLHNKLISELDSGKSSGPDNISPESLKFASNRLSVLLSLCFSVCLSHGYLPPAMIKTTIVPIVKNKCGNISESNNYRPIALATSSVVGRERMGTAFPHKKLSGNGVPTREILRDNLLLLLN